MIRFGFIIPFRPKSESSNWNQDVALLNSTLQAVLQQTYSLFLVYVVYTDAPSELLYDERINYVQFPFEFQPWEELPNREDLLLKMKFKQKAARRWDKGRKVSYGSRMAKEAGCDYLMALDSDDLLSKHFLAYLSSVSNNNTCMGWYMNKGYLYKQGAGYLIRVPHSMTALNGSTNILRADLVTVPDFNSLDWLDYSLFTDHGWVKERVKKYYNADLEPIPTAMLVYVVHRSNMSQVYQKEYGFHVKAVLKRLLRSIPLTRSLQDEFNLT